MKVTAAETYRELTASEITKDCLLILQARNCKSWRQVNTSVRNRKGVVTKGIPDVLFFNRSTGLFGAAEIKKIGDTLRPEQIEFLIELHESGGMALIGTQRGPDSVLVPFVEYYQKYKMK